MASVRTDTIVRLCTVSTMTVGSETRHWDPFPLAATTVDSEPHVRPLSIDFREIIVVNCADSRSIQFNGQWGERRNTLLEAEFARLSLLVGAAVRSERGKHESPVKHLPAAMASRDPSG